jgi:anti-sigma factor RsiW
MNCEQVRKLLDAFLNGRLSGDESRAVRKHLASCVTCSSSLSLEEKIEMLPALDETIEPSEDFAARFHAKLQQRKTATFPNFSGEKRGGALLSWRRPWPLATAGALAALLVVGIFVRHSKDGSSLPDNASDLIIADNLSLLEDLPVISNLDLLENFDAIEKMTPALEGAKEQRGIK